LSEDLQAFLTEPSRAEGGEARKKQARLDLLWAEWQTIQKTADLYVQKYFTDRKAALLAADAGVLTAQAARSQRALEAHNTTIDVAGSDLSAALDIEIRRDAAARAAMASDADLKTELNVEPNAELTLADPANPGTISKDEVAAGLKAMVNRRPDLLALQAGYHAQEEAVRTAILQQFPAVNFGMNRASDTTNVRTIGLAATIDVPILGNTQAKIRTERATREQLRSEYQARLDEAESDAWRLWRSLGLLREQIRQLEQSLPELRRMAQTGEEAYAAGNLAPATYVLLRTSLTSRESDLLDLKAMLWNDSTALRALLGLSPLVRGTPP
jgi:outer membrane protein TolC